VEIKQVDITKSRVVEEYPPQDGVCSECGRELSLHVRRDDNVFHDPYVYHGPELPCQNWTWFNRLQRPHFMVEFKGVAVVETIDHESPMMFGKYKGKKLSEVPMSYLNWIVRQYLTDVVRFSTEMRRRKVSNRLGEATDALTGQAL